MLLMAGGVYTLALECDPGNGQVIAGDTCACDPSLSSMVGWDPVKQLCMCNATEGPFDRPSFRIKERPCILRRTERPGSASTASEAWQDDHKTRKRELEGRCPDSGCQLCGVGDNLILNGGFEDVAGLEPWDLSRPSQYTFVHDSFPHSGGLHYVDRTVGPPNDLSQEVFVPASDTYELAFWLLNSGSLPNAFYVTVNTDIIDSYTDLGSDLEYKQWT